MSASSVRYTQKAMRLFRIRYLFCSSSLAYMSVISEYNQEKLPEE